ncbi:hypothetical protein N9317_03380 [Pelagibacteraceae bacterium]|nr:hypothetical protein [Pelagibacteraceae bacterium]
MIINYNHFNLNIKLNNSHTSNAIQNLNNFKAKINTWGEEIYFETPLKTAKLEPNSRDVIILGEVAYWVEGSSIAIGFGPTPASLGSEIRLVTKVNIIGNFDVSEANLEFLNYLKDDYIINIFINKL